MKKTLWVLFVLSALSIGFYPGIYFVVDRKFGLLSTKTEALLANTGWNIGFYVHILAGGLALLLGWSQFSSRLRNHSLSLHRSIGKISVAGIGLRSHTEVGARMFRCLAANSINVEMINTSELKLCVVISAAEADLAMTQLRAEFGLI